MLFRGFIIDISRHACRRTRDALPPAARRDAFHISLFRCPLCRLMPRSAAADALMRRHAAVSSISRRLPVTQHAHG